MANKLVTTLALAVALPMLGGACASSQEGESVVRDEEIQTGERQPRAGTGVLIVQNQTADPVEIYVEGDLLGTVEANDSGEFPNMPIIAASVEARGTGGETVDADNLDFASAGDNTVTFVVDGL